MPQLIDLAHPETVISWPDPQAPYMPWGWNQAGEGPLGEWLIEFMEKVQRRRLNYTLSAWWFNAASDHWNNLPAADRQRPCGGAGHLVGAWLPAPGDCGGVWGGRAYWLGLQRRAGQHCQQVHEHLVEQPRE
jgi:hypothetical protein